MIKYIIREGVKHTTITPELFIIAVGNTFVLDFQEAGIAINVDEVHCYRFTSEIPTHVYIFS